jgi:hypothetical protein
VTKGPFVCASRCFPTKKSRKFETKRVVVRLAFPEVGPSSAYEEKHVSAVLPELFLLEPNKCVSLPLPSNEITRKLPPRMPDPDESQRYE